MYQKEIWIDVLRAFACVCVLLVHAPAVSDGNIPGEYIIGPANFLLMAWGVAVFFMISGALLFSKAQDMVPFYKKRFSRILIPTIIWSIIYILYDDLFIEPNESVVHRILMIPFTHQTGLLWFIYSLVGIYLVTPIISCWLNNCKKRDLEIVLIMWGITLCLPLLQIFDIRCKEIIDVNGVLYHFYGFVGYALWGYYLRKYVNIKIISLKFLVLVILAFSVPILIFILESLPLDLLRSLMSFASALMATIAFLFFKSLSYKKSWFLGFIQKFAELSFGIYLCHVLFVRPLRYYLTELHIHYALQIPLTALVTGALSFLFVLLLSKIPKSRWLFG